MQMVHVHVFEGNFPLFLELWYTYLAIYYLNHKNTTFENEYHKGPFFIKPVRHLYFIPHDFWPQNMYSSWTCTYNALLFSKLWVALKSLYFYFVNITFLSDTFRSFPTESNSSLSCVQSAFTRLTPVTFSSLIRVHLNNMSLCLHSPGQEQRKNIQISLLGTKQLLFTRQGNIKIKLSRTQKRDRTEERIKNYKIRLVQQREGSGPGQVSRWEEAIWGMCVAEQEFDGLKCMIQKPFLVGLISAGTPPPLHPQTTSNGVCHGASEEEVTNVYTCEGVFFDAAVELLFCYRLFHKNNPKWYSLTSVALSRRHLNLCHTLTVVQICEPHWLNQNYISNLVSRKLGTITLFILQCFESICLLFPAQSILIESSARFIPENIRSIFSFIISIMKYLSNFEIIPCDLSTLGCENLLRHSNLAKMESQRFLWYDGFTGVAKLNKQNLFYADTRLFQDQENIKDLGKIVATSSPVIYSYGHIIFYFHYHSKFAWVMETPLLILDDWNESSAFSSVYPVISNHHHHAKFCEIIIKPTWPYLNLGLEILNVKSQPMGRTPTLLIYLSFQILHLYCFEFLPSTAASIELALKMNPLKPSRKNFIFRIPSRATCGGSNPPLSNSFCSRGRCEKLAQTSVESLQAACDRFALYPPPFVYSLKRSRAFSNPYGGRIIGSVKIFHSVRSRLPLRLKCDTQKARHRGLHYRRTKKLRPINTSNTITAALPSPISLLSVARACTIHRGGLSSGERDKSSQKERTTKPVGTAPEKSQFDVLPGLAIANEMLQRTRGNKKTREVKFPHHDISGERLFDTLGLPKFTQMVRSDWDDMTCMNFRSTSHMHSTLVLVILKVKLVVNLVKLNILMTDHIFGLNYRENLCHPPRFCFEKFNQLRVVLQSRNVIFTPPYGIDLELSHMNVVEEEATPEEIVLSVFCSQINQESDRINSSILLGSFYSCVMMCLGTCMVTKPLYNSLPNGFLIIIGFEFELTEQCIFTNFSQDPGIPCADSTGNGAISKASKTSFKLNLIQKAAIFPPSLHREKFNNDIPNCSIKSSSCYEHSRGYQQDLVYCGKLCRVFKTEEDVATSAALILISLKVSTGRSSFSYCFPIKNHQSLDSQDFKNHQFNQLIWATSLKLNQSISHFD
ncbi:hypothetical protein VP01_431g4 [Puccinia sorghi]|uniref:Uncharacterized protein n=1 Tax=Puccinia sorghi TaxID=27349 RepID=A0A0L6US11_9BASI|nr:hypothetical protein VP01_431g4 [Puccinia sorghi]